jgi:hypothetical protein
MGLNGVSSVTPTSASNKVNKTSNVSSVKSSTSEQDKQTPSAVYEKNKETNQKAVGYKQDTATISQLKAEAEKRTRSLRNLVEKMLLKQGQTFDESNMYDQLREGKVLVDPETAEQAKADIAEDGYWGVAQTSDRLVSFAIALTGGDPEKADEMIAAVKEGFKQAKETWGGELPEISQKTLDSTLEKLDDWKNSLSSNPEAK